MAESDVYFKFSWVLPHTITLPRLTHFSTYQPTPCIIKTQIPPIHNPVRHGQLILLHKLKNQKLGSWAQCSLCLYHILFNIESSLALPDAKLLSTQMPRCHRFIVFEDSPVFRFPLYFTFLAILNYNFLHVQWGSEEWTNLVFKWSKIVCS